MRISNCVNMNLVNIITSVVVFLVYFLYLLPSNHGDFVLPGGQCPQINCSTDVSAKSSLVEDTECAVDESLLIGLICQILGAQQYFDLIPDLPTNIDDEEYNFTCEMVLPTTEDPDFCKKKIEFIQVGLTNVTTEIAKMVMLIIKNPGEIWDNICKYQHDLICLQKAFDELEQDFQASHAQILKKIGKELERFQTRLKEIYERTEKLETQLTSDRLNYLAAWIQSGRLGVLGVFNDFFRKNRPLMITSLVNASLYEGTSISKSTAKYMGYVAEFITLLTHNETERWLAINQSYHTLLAKKEGVSEAILVLNQLALEELASGDWVEIKESIAKRKESFMEEWDYALFTNDMEKIASITEFANSLGDQEISQKSVSTQLPLLVERRAKNGTRFETLFDFCFSFNFPEHLYSCLDTLKIYTPDEFLFHLLLKIIDIKNNLLVGDPFIKSFDELIKKFPDNRRIVTMNCVHLVMGSSRLAGSSTTGSNEDYIHKAITYSDESKNQWKFEWVEEQPRSKFGTLPNYKFRLMNWDLVDRDLKHEYLGSHLNWEESYYSDGYVRTTFPTESDCWHPLHYYWRVEFLHDSDKIRLFHLGIESYFHSGLSLPMDYADYPEKEWKLEECIKE